MQSLIKRRYNPVVILKRFLLFALPVLLFFNIAYSAVYKSQKEALRSEYESQQHEALGIINHVLKSVFVSTYNDLMVVRNANEFSNYLNSSTQQNMEELRQLFYRVMLSKPNFRQLRYISLTGMELIRVNNDENGVHIVPDDELQDKSEMYYMDKATSTPEGTMYISDLDLNVENGETKFPYEPVLRFSVPVIDDDGTKLGVLVINYDGYKILSILDEYVDINQEIIEVGIYDSTHFWQFRKGNIQQNNVLTKIIKEEIVPLDVLNSSSDLENNYFEQNGRSYHVHFISTLEEVNIRLESDFGHIGIVSSYNLNEVLSKSGNVILIYRSIPYIISALILLVALIIILLSYKSKSASLMLDASKYISEYTHDGIVITDSQKKVIYCNSVFEDTFGVNFEMISGRMLSDFLRGDIKVTLPEKERESVWEGNIWEMSKDNTYILKFLKVKYIYDKKSDLAYYIGIYSEPKINKNILDRVVRNDRSTMRVENNLIKGISPIFNKSFDDNENNIVIVIKINDFVDIKNRVVDKEGNSFILNIAGKLKNLIGENGIVLAPGSDLFLIRTHFSGKDKDVELLMDDIDEVLSGFQFTDHSSINISYLSGVAISPKHGIDGIELLTNAFIALEAIIKLKRTNYLIYNESIYDIVIKDKTIRNELGAAFRRNEFTVLYQVQKSTNGKNIGTEALVRWKNKNLGVVPPGLFVPIMEESEYISKLGRYVLNTVVNDFKKVKDVIPKDFKISINLSSNEFMDIAIIKSLVRDIENSGLRAENFCFEITETTLVNNLENANEIIQYLHEKKVIVAIDDFGTGYSSLGYLKSLYADKLKIDQTFIKDYPKKDDGTMIKAIISMAKQLKIGVLAEGIETKEQLDLIKSLKCKEYQGYYSSKPVSFSKFVEQYLKAG